ncbi:MAG: hypothetical protein M3Q47_18735 [Actinomycetota bacterium]|nr:hypothetical protein [Actinomycetota bacterium]
MATDPPDGGPALAARLLTAPTLAVELARRGVTAQIGLLAEAELWSVYQPIVRLDDGAVVAQEALLRGTVDGREVGAEDLSSSPSPPAGCRGWTASAGSPRSPARLPGWGTRTCPSTPTRRRCTGRR